MLGVHPELAVHTNAGWAVKLWPWAAWFYATPCDRRHRIVNNGSEL